MHTQHQGGSILILSRRLAFCMYPSIPECIATNNKFIASIFNSVQNISMWLYQLLKSTILPNIWYKYGCLRILCNPAFGVECEEHMFKVTFHDMTGAALKGSCLCSRQQDTKFSFGTLILCLYLIFIFFESIYIKILA